MPSKVMPSHSFKWTTARCSSGNRASAPASWASKDRLVGIGGGGEDFSRLDGERFRSAFAHAAAAHEVDRKIVRQPEEKGPFVADAVKRCGPGCQPSKQILQDVARVCHVPGQVEHERKHRPAVGVVDPFQFGGVSHLLQGRAGMGNLSMPNHRPLAHANLCLPAVRRMGCRVKGREKLDAYREQKNSRSLDEFPAFLDKDLQGDFIDLDLPIDAGSRATRDAFRFYSEIGGIVAGT